MITLASQQGTPWLGFNGFGGGFGDVGSGWTLAPTGVWTAPDGTSGWARNADGTYTASVVDGLGNVIVYTVTEAMVPVNTVTVPPGGDLADVDWWSRLSGAADTLLRAIGLGTPSTTTPIPAGSSSLLNPGTWSLPMMLLIGGGVYWLASSRTRTRAGHRSRARRR